jgi:HD-GYP domain-containing protein (c-di-GMP phosphodiesterase class II)
VGYEIVSGVEFHWPIAQMIHQHHERLDGSGYPQGLAGDQVIQEARILAVADVVESMASHRPYRPALGIDAALEEVETHAGTLYDPVVVASCVRLFRDGLFQLD